MQKSVKYSLNKLNLINHLIATILVIQGAIV